MKEMCLEIMDRIMKLPCAAVFLDPVNPERDGVPNYYTFIKHPIDLGSIYKKLLNNEYNGFHQWDKDMNLVWTNAEKFYKKNSYIGALADELRKHYEKEHQKLKVLRIAKWSRVVIGFRTELEQLFDQVPPILGTLAQKNDRESADQQLKQFSEEELNILIRMIGYLKESTDSQNMAKIILLYQPETKINESPFEIDVNDLKLETLYSLRDYVSFRLAEMNLAYPK